MSRVSGVMRAFTGAHQDWLTVVQMPAYAPDLNPVEGTWSTMKNGLGNPERLRLGPPSFVVPVARS